MDNNSEKLSIVITLANGDVSAGPFIDSKLALSMIPDLNKRYGSGTHQAASAETLEKMRNGEVDRPVPIASYRTLDDPAFLNPTLLASVGMDLNVLHRLIANGSAAKGLYDNLTEETLYESLQKAEQLRISSPGIHGFLVGDVSEPTTASKAWAAMSPEIKQVLLSDDPAAEAAKLGIDLPVFDGLANFQLSPVMRAKTEFITVPLGDPAAEDEAAGIRLPGTDGSANLHLSTAVKTRVPQFSLPPDEHEIDAPAPVAKSRVGAGYGIGSLAGDKKKSSDVKPK